MRVSIRSLLVAGVSVTAVSASVVSSPAEGSLVATSAAPAYRLTAAVSPLLPPVETAAAAEYAPVAESTAPTQPAAAVASAGDFIINAYNAIEPWVAWGFELVQWGMSFVPGLWWIAPGVDLLYFTWEPVVQSLVYSFAYLIDGNFSLIGPAIQEGIQEAAYNFVQYSIYWLESIIPFPPLPPFPFPFLAAAAASTPGVTRAAAATTATEAPATEAPATDAVTTEAVVAETAIETAIETATETEATTETETDAVITAEETTEVTAEETAEVTTVETAEVTAVETTAPAPRGAKRSAANARAAQSTEAAAPSAAEEAAAPTAGADAQDGTASGHRSGKAGASSSRAGR